MRHASISPRLYLIISGFFKAFCVWSLILGPLVSISVFAQEFNADLNNHPQGVYSEALMESDFGSAQELNNHGNRFQIISGSDAYDGQSLRVHYLAGETGATNSGGQFFAFLPPEDEYYLDYYIKFSDDFDFQMGGKLPGLSGGESNSGGNKPTGDGWSARYMWRENGALSVYLYHMDQPTSYGEYFALNRNATPGTWHRLTQRVKVNTGNNNDGELQVWFDGELVLLRTDIRYRNNNQAPVDHFFFSTFYGGNTPEWEPDNDGYTFFDNFKIGTNKDDIIPDAEGGLLTQIDKPSNAAVFESPASIEVEASAFSIDETVSSVQLFANGTLIGEDNTAPYLFDWSNVTPGTYSLTTLATTTDGSQSESVPITVTVNDIDPNKGPNLALNKSVTVSEEQEGNRGEGAVDGSADSEDRWSAQGFPQSLTVDLGALTTVNLAELVPFNDRAYRYVVEGSTDGISYSTLVDRSNNTEEGALLSNTFSPASARYVRLSVSSAHNYTGEWVSIVEFRLFNTDGTSPEVVWGDATGDGQLSALDASLMLQHSVGLITFDADQLSLTDVSGNGEVSPFDASLVLQRVVELIDCLPVEPGCDS